MDEQPQSEPEKKEQPAPATSEQAPRASTESGGLPDFELPKLPPAREIPAKIVQKLQQYARVYKITKKPTMEEYKAVVKVSGIGILLIGAIGFIIYMIIQLLEKI